ncbi:transmembrane protein [Mycobacterium bohemicum DSM 44277]|uniref:Transmembrane protein n=1 Tax=Mycobacterium bohemicum DSM 44277 TaxID=1236609 RepID=A0A0U0WDN9_MYCBE|nr:transmembrane protein [Mycobacterium bohemicum DSM 44277]
MPHDAPVRNPDLPREEASRGKYWWLRWVILGIVAIVLAVEVSLGFDQLAKAWTTLYEAKWWWLLAAVVAAAASMHSFAQIQRTLLRSAGVHVKQLRSEAAFYAANSLSTTLPGGPVLSATFLLRQQRLWGAPGNAGRPPPACACCIMPIACGMLIGSLHCVDRLVSGCAIDVMSPATLGLASK